jgi:plasmid stabilization system protein ParE
MIIRWTAAALRDRDAIYRYLALETGRDRVSQRVDAEIVEATTLLAQFPHSGRVGRVENTREMLTANAPYKLIYQAQSTQVVILRVVHQRQLWPPKRL